MNLYSLMPLTTFKISLTVKYYTNKNDKTFLLMVLKSVGKQLQASHCKKVFLRTQKIFKFKDIFKEWFTSTYNYWL